ncbi:MAG: MurR/RpiR family transcriptional regulator [Faecalibacillus sp.]
MKNLFYRLLIYLDSANESDTNYNIAWYMAHNLSSVANMGISKLARECFVSPATISRFCRALGYENYAHLKQECSYYSSSKRKFSNLIDVPLDMMKNDPQKCSEYYSLQVSQGVKNLSLYLNWDVIDKVLKQIHDSENVAFFGIHFSQSAALHFQTDLLMLGKFTTAYLESERLMECAKRLDENSLAIVISVSGNLVNSCQKILNYIKKSKAKVVFITNNPEIELGMDVKYLITIGDKDNLKIGKHNLLTTMELMALRYYSMYYTKGEGEIK